MERTKIVWKITYVRVSKAYGYETGYNFTFFFSFLILFFLFFCGHISFCFVHILMQGDLQ